MNPVMPRLLTSPRTMANSRATPPQMAATTARPLHPVVEPGGRSSRCARSESGLIFTIHSMMLMPAPARATISPPMLL